MIAKRFQDLAFSRADARILRGTRGFMQNDLFSFNLRSISLVVGDLSQSEGQDLFQKRHLSPYGHCAKDLDGMRVYKN